MIVSASAVREVHLAVLSHQHVVAAAGVEAVATGAAVKRVVAAAPEEDVATGPAREAVCTVASKEHVVAFPADKDGGFREVRDDDRIAPGATVGLLSGAPPLRRGLRQLAIGFGAAAITYLLGLLFGVSAA